MTAKTADTAAKGGSTWSDAERAAIQAGAAERKRSAKRDPAREREDGERDLLAKVAEMPQPDRQMAERLHGLISEAAPDLVPRTYYGMPAYAKDGKTVCYFKPASKFKERYATFGFEQAAALDDGSLWPVAWALKELTPAGEQQIVALVKKAVGKE